MPKSVVGVVAEAMALVAMGRTVEAVAAAVAILLVVVMADTLDRHASFGQLLMDMHPPLREALRLQDRVERAVGNLAHPVYLVKAVAVAVAPQITMEALAVADQATQRLDVARLAEVAVMVQAIRLGRQAAL